MNIINELQLKIGSKEKIIYFGTPDNKKELDEMFRLRYAVYSSKNYLNPNGQLDSLDKDEYDLKNKCNYFAAKIDNKIIGTIRLIQDKFLPTEKECFKFEEPEPIKKIPREKRGELSRLIIIPYSKKQYLPRNLVFLFLMDCVVKFFLQNNILGGYSFITNKLYNKIKKLKIPIHIITSYKQIYPKDGLLYPYFNQQNNSIIPVYYLGDEIKDYLEEIFAKKRLFKKIASNRFILRPTLYNKFLRSLKVI